MSRADKLPGNVVPQEACSTGDERSHRMLETLATYSCRMKSSFLRCQPGALPCQKGIAMHYSGGKCNVECCVSSAETLTPVNLRRPLRILS